MNKIVFKKARIKNFLSYGNTWQEIEFPNGINLVQGYNKDTGKSNGAGKSSITEIIPFAMFGKTIKDLPQAKIVNWSNRNACMVELYLDVNGDEYVFKRGLRPNKFTVSLNGVDIVRPSDIKTFQYQLEENVIGMDFKTFKNLVYFSPNNTISILGAKKDDKRKFLESLFDLSDYSEMLKIVNSKIQSAKERTTNAESAIDHCNSIKLMLRDDIDGIKLPDIKDIRIGISKLEIMVNGLEEKVFDTLDIPNYDQFVEHLTKSKDDREKVRSDVLVITEKINNLKTLNANIDIDKPVKQKESILLRISDIQTKIDNIDRIFAEKEIINLKEEIVSLLQDVKELEEDIITTDKRIEVNGYVRQSNFTSIADIEARKHNISGKDVCDFCGSECDHDKILKYHESQIYECKSEIEQKDVLIASDKGIFGELRQQVIDKKVMIEDTTKDIKSYEVLIANHEIYNKDLESLQEQLKLLPDVDLLKLTIQENELSIEDHQQKLRDLGWKSDYLEEDIGIYEDKIKAIDDIKVEIDKHNVLLSESQTKLGAERVRLHDFNTRIKEIEDDKQQKELKILEQDAIIEELSSKISKLNMMIDHLGYLRVSLKDENVKQFAISALLPYLNQRSNYYLSESGFPYVVDIDGWLDVTIMGMGTEGVGYKSLSGGESKAMDMAIQLACNDIAELHAKTLLGIAIYDEIMDTSLDADGVVKLMDIIGVKQRDTGNCILIISHRDEVKELDFDNYIMTEKENGFSVIQPQTIMV